ncbi:glycoside hydrolase family 3 C-terminal domain-containing protein [Streptomyces sp. L7]
MTSRTQGRLRSDQRLRRRCGRGRRDPVRRGRGRCRQRQRPNPHPADQAAVDKVCAAMKCAVLIVSGRPQLIGDRLPKIDAVVASWLPGTEGDGVADVLYGKHTPSPVSSRSPGRSRRPSCRSTSVTRRHDPQFPHGWGLTTVTKAPTGGASTLKALEAAAAKARSAGTGKALVTQARLIVQQKVGQNITAAVSKPFADADHLLLTGKYAAAVKKLEEAYRAA